MAFDLVGRAPFWAMPTRPLCPLKSSQLANPVVLVITFTRRAICDSVALRGCLKRVQLVLGSAGVICGVGRSVAA